MFLPHTLLSLNAMETRAFKIIGISRDEAESMGLSLRHRRQVGGLFVFYRTSFLVFHTLHFPCFARMLLQGHTRSTTNLLQVKLLNSRITAHLH